MSFGWYLLAFCLPPVYFLARGRILAGLLNGVVWVIGLVLSFALIGVPIVMLCIAHAMWDVSHRLRDENIQKQAKAIAEEMSHSPG